MKQKMKNPDSVKFILKAVPKTRTNGHYFNGYFQVGNNLISVSISVGENGQVIYNSEQAGGEPFIYATATNWGVPKQKTMSKGYKKEYSKKI